MCQHCAFPQRDQSVQSGRAPSSQVETLQQRGDPSIPEQSMCTVFSSFLFFNFAISPSCVWAYSDSLKTKHVISHALRLRLVLFDESNRKLRKRLSSLPPPLLSLIFFFSVDQRENSRVNWVIKYRNLSSRLNCWDTEDDFLWEEWNVLPFRAHFKQSMVKEKD